MHATLSRSPPVEGRWRRCSSRAWPAPARLITALGDDDCGRRSLTRLREFAVNVRAKLVRCADASRGDARGRSAASARSQLSASACSRAEARMSLSGSRLTGLDAVYFTAGDEAALRTARAASRVLVASPRARPRARARRADRRARAERRRRDRAPARWSAAAREAAIVVLTEGERGGSYRTSSGEHGRFEAATPTGRSGRRLRLRRLVRSRLDLRARRRPATGAGAGTRRPLRRGVPDRTRALQHVS